MQNINIYTIYQIYATTTISTIYQLSTLIHILNHIDRVIIISEFHVFFSKKWWYIVCIIFKLFHIICCKKHKHFEVFFTFLSYCFSLVNQEYPAAFYMFLLHASTSILSACHNDIMQRYSNKWILLLLSAPCSVIKIHIVSIYFLTVLRLIWSFRDISRWLLPSR